MNRGCHCRCCGGPHLGSGLYLLQSLYHDPVGWLQSLGDDPGAPGLVGHLDLSDLGYAVGTHHKHVVGPLKLLHRSLRNDDGVLAGGDGKPDPAELAWAQQTVGIGKGGLNRQRTGLGADTTAHHRYATLLGEHRTVGQNQLQPGCPAADPSPSLRLARPSVGQVFRLRNREIEPDGIE